MQRIFLVRAPQTARWACEYSADFGPLHRGKRGLRVETGKTACDQSAIKNMFFARMVYCNACAFHKGKRRVWV